MEAKIPDRRELFASVSTRAVREAIHRVFAEDLREHYRRRAENAPDESESRLWQRALAQVV